MGGHRCQIMKGKVSGEVSLKWGGPWSWNIDMKGGGGGGSGEVSSRRVVLGQVTDMNT